MQVYHCPNQICKQIVFKNHKEHLPPDIDIEMRCFHCGEYIRITTENTIVVKKLILVEGRKRRIQPGFIG